MRKAYILLFASSVGVGLLFLSGGSKSTGTLVRDEVFINDTNICSIYYDSSKTNTPCRLALFTHGLNQSTFDLHNDLLTGNLIHTLASNGWVIVADEAQGSSYGFGSPTERVAHSNSVQYVLSQSNRYNIRKLDAVIGQSMGGVSAHYFTTNSGVTHGVFIYPIVDLGWAHNSGYMGGISNSYNGLFYPLIPSGHDPMKFDVAVWNNKRLLYLHSPADTAVNYYSNSLAMVAKAPLARLITTSEDHGHTSNFDDAAVSNIVYHLDQTNVVAGEYRVSWSANTNVGVIGGPIARTSETLVDCPTNGTDCSAAWQAAINAASSNDVLRITNGFHVLSNAVAINKSYVTLRGAGVTNTIVFTKGTIKVGADADNYLHTKTDIITNGATKGSMSITLSNIPTFAAGDLLLVFGRAPPTELLQIYSIGIPYFEPFFPVLCTGTNGRTVTLATPFPFDFTNGPAFIAKLHSQTYKGIGIENMTITGTNTQNEQITTANYLVQFSVAANCWMTNVLVEWANAYHIGILESAHITVRRNHIRRAFSSGSNHAGILTGGAYCLIEDNILSDGLQPAIEFNGAVFNAFFGNFFTNNLSDVDAHGAHPMMNLWEANVMAEYPAGEGVTDYYGAAWMLDGYFGSASHQTLFRNSINSWYTPVYLKRWSSYVAIVGNVLGSSRAGIAYTNFSHDYNGIPYQIVEMGRPNIGNQNYVRTNAPVAWNDPGTSNRVDLGGGNFFAAPNGIWRMTNTHVNTNVLLGNFTNVPASGALIFRDTNSGLYYPQDGTAIYVYSAGTSSNIVVSQYPGVAGGSFTVSNGWQAWWVSSANLEGYQQLITTNRTTHLITGNFDYFNDAQTWDNPGRITLPDSYLYASAPSWWGANRWPAIQPDSVTLVTAIPAQDRYNGVVDGGSAPSKGGTISATRSTAVRVSR